MATHHSIIPGSAHVFEGYAVHYTGSDGYPAAELAPGVVVTDTDGQDWVLANGYRIWRDEDMVGVQFDYSYDKAERIAAAVNDRLYIDLDAAWHEHVSRIDLETLLEEEWEREMEERQMYGAA